MAIAAVGPCDHGVASAARRQRRRRSIRPERSRRPSSARAWPSSTARSSTSACRRSSATWRRRAPPEHRSAGSSMPTCCRSARCFCSAASPATATAESTCSSPASALFSAASLACALAPGFAWLLAMRAAQGIGAALLMPASLAILGAAFSGEARGRAVGTWAAAGACDRRARAARRRLADRRRSAGARSSSSTCRSPPSLRGSPGATSTRAAATTRRPLDVGGAFLATVGLGLLTFGLTVVAARIGTGGASVAAGATLGLLRPRRRGVLALVAFVVLEARLGQRAMMPLALFGTRDLRRRQHPHPVPLRRARRHDRAAAVPADPQRRLFGRGRRRGAAAAVDRDGPRLACRGSARRADRRAHPPHGRADHRRRSASLLFLRVGTRRSSATPPCCCRRSRSIACGLTLSVAPLTAGGDRRRRCGPCRLGLGRQQRDRARRRPARDRAARLSSSPAMRRARHSSPASTAPRPVGAVLALAAGIVGVRAGPRPRRRVS